MKSQFRIHSGQFYMGNYKAKADRQSNKFMKSARAFLATKLTGNADGDIPPEFELNLTLLESYYKTFIMLQMEIDDMDSIVTEGRYGPMVSPVCAARDKACVRLESLMKQMGLTLKAGKMIGTTEVKKEQSVLERYMSGKTKK